MTRQDVCKLFDLLDQLYQGKQKQRDRVTLAIWAEVLKPWSYEQVRDAAVQRARENRFSPDPSELAAYLPPLAQEGRGTDDSGRYAPIGEAERKSMERLRAWQQEWHQELREQGLPTMREADEQGMNLKQWQDLLRESGAWDEEGRLSLC